MDLKFFEKIGMSRAEIDVYLMLLKESPNTATSISKKTNLNRSHIYDTITKLIEKGLASSYEMNNVKYFSASNPEKITEHIKEVKDNAEKIVLELKKIKSSVQEESKVQLFKGKNGLKTSSQGYN